MTQAIALFQGLRECGCEISHILIGKSNQRSIPDYFLNAFDVPIEPIDSPNFVTDDRKKSIRLLYSIIYNLRYVKRFFKSLNKIDQLVRKENPDAIVNFCELLGGMYSFIYKPEAKIFAIGHHYLADHPDFPFPPGRWFQKSLFKLYNYISAWGACRKFALSFRPYEPSVVGRTFVVPPLLRRELKKQRQGCDGFILGYILNEGYSEEIILWSRNHPQVKLHIFWDKSDAPEIDIISEALTFHRLNSEKFLRLMASCDRLLTTAGFETICEAMYLGKSVLIVPVKGHYEQECNANDALFAEAGIVKDHFDISSLIQMTSNCMDSSRSFRSWYVNDEYKIRDMLLEGTEG